MIINENTRYIREVNIFLMEYYQHISDDKNLHLFSTIINK